MKNILFIFIIFSPVLIFGQPKGMEFFPPKEKRIMFPIKKDLWFGEDKAKHLLISFFLTGAAAYYCRHHQKWSDEKSIAFGTGFSFSIGLAKEIKDLRSDDHLFSWKDLAVDLIGIGLGGVLLSWW